mgnify:FL=1
MNDRKVRTEIQKWLDNTWDNFPPEFFITIHYKDLPTKIERVKEHIHHFNNVLFRKFHGVSRSVKVPPITQRIMVQHFHELNPITIKSKSGLPRQKLVYHTHT